MVALYTLIKDLANVNEITELLRKSFDDKKKIEENNVKTECASICLLFFFFCSFLGYLNLSFTVK